MKGALCTFVLFYGVCAGTKLAGVGAADSSLVRSPITFADMKPKFFLAVVVVLLLLLLAFARTTPELPRNPGATPERVQPAGAKAQKS